jgi:hypothetical protein
MIKLAYIRRFADVAVFRELNNSKLEMSRSAVRVRSSALVFSAQPDDTMVDSNIDSNQGDI